MNYFKDLISPGELAQATGLTLRRIQQLAPDLIAQGLAIRLGKPLVCHKSAIKHILDLPETRGRKKTPTPP